MHTMLATRAALLAAALASATAFQLSQQYVVVQAVGENDAVKLALRDVEQNLYTVTGVAPVFLGSAPAPNSLPPNTIVIYVGTTTAAPWLLNFNLPEACMSGWEAHCVVAFPSGAPGTSNYTSIVATGVGMRGAIFAGYEFTDTVLGFKPLFLFTDTPAAYAGPNGVTVDDNLQVIFTPPQYKYRAYFVNDEDLTANARADPLGKNVIDLAAWDTFFQTALRMKVNMFLVGTNPFPDDTATELCSRRGIVVSHHHYDL
jgi:hypothetical protein